MSARRRGRWRVWTAGTVGGTLTLSLVTHLRFLSYHSGDAASHGFIGAQIWSGRLPYSGVFDNKPPLVYFLLAPVHLVAPRSLAALSVMSALVTGVTSLIVAYWVPIAKSSRQRVVFAGMLTVLLNAPFVEGIAFNTEQVMTLFVAASIAAAFRVSRGGALAAGVLISLAVLSKQVGILFVPIPLIILARWSVAQTASPSHSPSSRRSLAGLFGLGAMLPVISLALLYGLVGHLKQLWFSTVVFGIQYSAAGQGGAAERLPPSRSLFIFVTIGCALTAVTVLRWRQNRDLLSALLPLWFVAALLGAQIGGRNFFHYYAPAIAPAVCMGALLLASRVDRTVPSARVVKAGVLAAGMLLLSLVGKEIVRPRPQPRTLDDGTAIARYLETHRRPGDSVHVAGYRPEIYFRSGLRAATRFVYDFPTPPYDQFHAEIAAQLAAAPPRYYVVVGRGIVRPDSTFLNRYRTVLVRGKVRLLELKGASEGVAHGSDLGLPGTPKEIE